MGDNSKNRLVDVFFYGLYMDPEILQSKNVIIRNQRIAEVKNYQLRIGNKATLLRKENSSAFGMIYSLTHEELDRLYAGSGVTGYVAEAIIATTKDRDYSVLCCNLLEPPLQAESNKSYEERLALVMKKLHVPCHIAENKS